MAKSTNLDNIPLAQLEAAIALKKRARVDESRAKRTELLRTLHSLDSEIEALTGRARTGQGGGGRGPRGPSMVSLILQHLATSKANEVGMRDLTERLRGFTTSPKPESVISQAIFGMKKSGLVASAGRGLYRLTAAGRKSANDTSKAQS